MSKTTVGKYVLKQEFSSARSLRIHYEIAWHDKTVQVHMESVGGRELLNPDALVDLARAVLPDRYGIVAYDQDIADSKHPTVTTWRVVLTLAARKFDVRLIQPIAGSMIVEICARD